MPSSITIFTDNKSYSNFIYKNKHSTKYICVYVGHANNYDTKN